MKSFFPYHRRHRLAIARFFLQDLYYWLCASLFRRNIALPKALNRILLVNPAHLGDVVISTAILRELRNQFPKWVIDFFSWRLGFSISSGVSRY